MKNMGKSRRSNSNESGGNQGGGGSVSDESVREALSLSIDDAVSIIKNMESMSSLWSDFRSEALYNDNGERIDDKTSDDLVSKIRRKIVDAMQSMDSVVYEKRKQKREINSYDEGRLIEKFGEYQNAEREARELALEFKTMMQDRGMYQASIKPYMDDPNLLNPYFAPTVFG